MIFLPLFLSSLEMSLQCPRQTHFNAQCPTQPCSLGQAGQGPGWNLEIHRDFSAFVSHMSLKMSNFTSS